MDKEISNIDSRGNPFTVEASPFLEVIARVVKRRKEYHLNKVGIALDILYADKDDGQIELYEKAIDHLSGKVITKKLLEGKVEEDTASEKVGSSGRRNLRRGDPRPRLDYETYTEARNHGMTDEEIKTWFRTDSWRQVGGYRMAYHKLKKKGR